MRVASAFLVTMLLSISVFAQSDIENCKAMFAYGVPKADNTQEKTHQLCRKLYVLEYSPSKKTPIWVAERLIGSNLDASAERVNAFKPDPDLPESASATLKDYVGSKMDKGHMAPVGDMHSDEVAMLESFYLSNMVPQEPGTNRVIWRALEEKTRELATARGEIFVITGPIYEIGYRTIGDGRVAVPTKLYKILIDTEQRVVLVFIIPNVALPSSDLPKYVSSLRKLKKLTKINFFPTEEKPLTVSTKIWGRTSSD